MKRHEFSDRFVDALHAAAVEAEDQLGRAVPRQFRILLHGAGYSGTLLTPGAAMDALYIDEDHLYRIIDFSACEVDDEYTTVFVRASAHPPGPIQVTWNTPPGTGPFKQLGPRTPMKVMTKP